MYQVDYQLLFGGTFVVISGTVFLSLWTWAANSERFSKYRLHDPKFEPPRRVDRMRRIPLIIAFDFLLCIAYLVFGYDWLIKPEQDSLLTMIAQVLAVLVIYDLMFYWVHRLFHLPFLMRHVHAIHHKVRSPRSIDDFYLHVVDAAWVITLFFSSVAVVGPLSTNTLILTLFVYVFIHNTLHSGLNFPHPLFKLTNYWARKHDAHHNTNVSANFGSIFPIWDVMFGTNVKV